MSFDEEKDNSYAKFTNPISMMDSDDDMQKSVDFPQYTESEDPQRAKERSEKLEPQ